MVRSFQCIIMIVLFVGLLGCTDSKNAKHVLASQGYKQIEITGYDIFGCSEDDFYHTGFKAVGVNGENVSGVVCQGIFKGATIRIK